MISFLLLCRIRLGAGETKEESFFVSKFLFYSTNLTERKGILMLTIQQYNDHNKNPAPPCLPFVTVLFVLESECRFQCRFQCQHQLRCPTPAGTLIRNKQRCCHKSSENTYMHFLLFSSYPHIYMLLPICYPFQAQFYGLFFHLPTTRKFCFLFFVVQQ